MNDEILKLGKLIIEENNVTEYDTLNRWMINYIAEKIIAYENAKTDIEKFDAEKKCRDAIITFWKNKHFNPTINPFQEFVELYDAIKELKKTNESTVFFDFLNNYQIENENLSKEIKKIKRSTNILLRNILHKHVTEIKDEKLLKWIGVSKGIKDNEDSLIIADLIKDSFWEKYSDAKDKEILELQQVGELYLKLAEELKKKKND